MLLGIRTLRLPNESILYAEGLLVVGIDRCWTDTLGERKRETADGAGRSRPRSFSLETIGTPAGCRK